MSGPVLQVNCGVTSLFFPISFMMSYISIRIACLSHKACFVVHLFADELVHEKEKYKYICDDLDMTFTELIGN